MKISIKVNTTPEEIAKMKRLKELSKITRRGDKTGNVLGRYLTSNNNYSKQISDKIMEEETKCACGANVSCECEPNEKPKQETVEEKILKIEIGLGEIELKTTKELLASCEKALEDRNIQISKMYSEEEVYDLLLKAKIETSIKYYEDMKEWFEQVKKK